MSDRQAGPLQVEKRELGKSTTRCAMHSQQDGILWHAPKQEEGVGDRRLAAKQRSRLDGKETRNEWEAERERKREELLGGGMVVEACSKRCGKPPSSITDDAKSAPFDAEMPYGLKGIKFQDG